jgi:site-specific DNA-methyltransferase (adenine-specific)
MSSPEQYDEIIGGLHKEVRLAEAWFDEKAEKVWEDEDKYNEIIGAKKQYKKEADAHIYALECLKAKILTNNAKSINIQNIDCIDGLKTIQTNSIGMVNTDPPYFIDGMGNDWNHDKLKKKETNAKVIGSLPVGMKFDPQQGVKFQEFMTSVGKELYRILKPGGFALSFSQARLYHRLAMAFENCGFEIRDMIGWTYEGQAKAFSQDHFVRKMKISNDKKDAILKKLDGRKTPQLKPMIEPIVLAQKPKEGTFIENWMNYGVGLIDTSIQWNNKFPGNIIECKKPSKKERGEFNLHFTVKPVKLIEHLIKVFTTENETILDPFLGSGTTALACLNTNRKFIGFEIDKTYYDICMKRLEIQYEQYSEQGTANRKV